MKIYFTFLSIFCYLTLFAQLPYTQDQFGNTVEEDIFYGVEVNYAGVMDSLFLDIYKPTGDPNCKRPVMVLVHGGAWVAGTKQDPAIVSIAERMAKKGWVVASIKYRLGTHKAANYDMYWACNNQLSAPCGYIADSAEIYRAIYRGMQDAKGAIRFMKSRHNIDSTDIHNVFIAGESAGGFVALATAFVDDNSEKPADAFAIANAPNPDTDLTSCNPANTSLSRPDLGDIDGTLHTGTYDATVKGVGSIYGGLLDLDVIDADDDVVTYLFHQGSDVVVHYNYGRLLGRTSFECYAAAGNICQPYYFYPFAYGGDGIKQHLNGMTNPPAFQADIISNYSYNGNCLSNGHSIDNITLRTQNMVELFAPVIAVSGNDPAANCTVSGVEDFNTKFIIYPNPVVNSKFTIEASEIMDDVTIFDMTGRRVFTRIIKSEKIEIPAVTLGTTGIYIVQVKMNNKVQYLKLNY